MLEIKTLDDISVLSENYEVECKLAAGKDGQGELPKDFWPTYSAFANSYGGEVVLGLKETKKGFRLNGIFNLQKVLDDLWSTLNDPGKISVNLLQEKDVRTFKIDGKNLIQISIPKAGRKQKPVFISNNPLTGTYKRFNTGDSRCDRETVKRMLAEQVEDSRDNELLKGYGIEDIDLDSFNAYRRLYMNLNLDHPWNQIEPIPFLKNIGAWRINRETGAGALTRAGLLMFGALPSIQEVFPNYMLDYQERPEAKIEARWIDRLTLDGAWSGNLFDFYRKVIKKLTEDLKVPFKLEKDLRQENTLVHQALREALVNCIVHADYTDRASVLIVKRPDLFGFRNPGLMRVPKEIAIQGGESDCRNRLIHQMFRYIGLGEQAGSGIPKIYQGWDSQHWRSPVLYEKEVPFDQTLLELRMLDLFPDQIVDDLRRSIGAQFDRLPELERLILASAATEQTISHRRMTEISTEHAHDLTLAFQRLMKAKLLESHGHGRGMVYHLPGQRLPSAEQAFSQSSVISLADSDPSDISLGHNGIRLGHNERHNLGWLSVEGLVKPLIDDLNLVSDEIEKSLMEQAEKARNQKRLNKKEMIQIILTLCSEYYLTQQVLAQLLNRKPLALRKNTLKPLLDQGKLALAFPQTPTHSKQAYTSVNRI
ncbi:RNA-binding domain-containing protein [uncultured Desulfobacter sp.]|uniref:RNA-binding domain-containing protein n=1 Tax=uncultured Desulfobacter sp. TaxID=240139 RepID=UPI0029F4C428|nr:RNA-binding domain-containing protein [uncultured Desulfobacter sp.]